MAQPKMDHNQEYVILLDLLARVNNANKGFSSSDISDGERLWDAHCLVNKFIGHALTILYLSHSTIVQDLSSFKRLKFIDSASIDVLTRAAMEAFLVFHYVFFAPATVEEKDYRYWAYEAAGIAERQNFPIITEETRRTLDNDKVVLDKLRDKLKSNAIFQSLKDGEKGQIFKGKGNWKWKPDGKGAIYWHDIAIDAGLSEMLAKHMYSHLCGYAHSGSMSVLQTAQALLNKETGQLIQSSIDTMNILVANMIQEYCGLFPKANTVLIGDLEGNESVKLYIEIGRHLDDVTR